MNYTPTVSLRRRRNSSMSQSLGQIQVSTWLIFTFGRLPFDEFSPTLHNTHKSSKFSCFTLQLILGPMFSGKSTELIRRLQRYQIARYECLIIKYAKDVRYDDDSIATHDRQTLKAVSANKLDEIDPEMIKNCDVIGIDEGQFFPDVVNFCEKAADAGKVVLVAALDGTYQRRGFDSGILNLVPLAEHVIKLTAVCMICFGEGSYTKRISDDKEVIF